MTTAYITSATRNSKIKIRGAVTIKGDKTSISIFDSRSYCSADRYTFKQHIIKNIIPAKFIHPDVTTLVEEKAIVPQLVELLTEETKSLKLQYLDFTEKYAKRAFDSCVERSKWTIAKWFECFNVKYEMKKSAYSEQYYPEIERGNSNRRNYSRMQSTQTGVRNTIIRGYDNYLSSELMLAEEHYKGSIEKLADRIAIKNLNMNSIVIKTSHIGVNIDMVITDGTQTVKAFTIIAEGAIQRPHYRYLIK